VQRIAICLLLASLHGCHWIASYEEQPVETRTDLRRLPDADRDRSIHDSVIILGDLRTNPETAPADVAP
jgi:hypothetical protein